MALATWTGVVCCPAELRVCAMAAGFPVAEFFCGVSGFELPGTETGTETVGVCGFGARLDVAFAVLTGWAGDSEAAMGASGVPV